MVYDWKPYFRTADLDRIDLLGKEIAQLRQDVDIEKNYALYSAKWFELFQICQKAFCHADVLSLADNTPVPTKQTYDEDSPEKDNSFVDLSARVPVEVQEAFQQVMFECIDKYDPKKGKLSYFLQYRFKRRLAGENQKSLNDYQADDKDNYRHPEEDKKKYEAVFQDENTSDVPEDIILEEVIESDLENESELEDDNDPAEDEETKKEKKRERKNKKAPVSLDGALYSEDGEKQSYEVEGSLAMGGGIDELAAEASVDQVFLSLTADIIELSKKLQMRKRVKYYSLFYTSDMISFLKIRKSRPFFRHEDKAETILLRAFVDFCMLRTCSTLIQIQDTPLKYLYQIFADYDESDKRQIPIPIEEDIELAYMNHSAKTKEEEIVLHTLRAQKSFYNALYQKIRERKE